MLLHIHKDLTDSLQLVDVANDFIAGNDHQKKTKFQNRVRGIWSTCIITIIISIHLYNVPVYDSHEWLIIKISSLCYAHHSAPSDRPEETVLVFPLQMKR